jgi:flagellar protein FliO/FliZ
MDSRSHRPLEANGIHIARAIPGRRSVGDVLGDQPLALAQLIEPRAEHSEERRVGEIQGNPTQGCKLCLVEPNMVKRDLISAAQINTSFTKPAQPKPSISRTEALVDLLDIARTVFALIATLALIVGAAYGARRLGMLQHGANGPKRMRITETLLLDPRRRMVIVRVDEREHVLLLGPGGDVVLGDMAAKEMAPLGETAT